MNKQSQNTVSNYLGLFVPIVRLTRQAIYTYNVTEARSGNNCWSGRAISITYSECMFVALVILHAVRMRHIVICGFPALKYFSTSQKRHDFFFLKVIEYKMCVLIFLTAFV
jgi:hypothetical protein